MKERVSTLTKKLKDVESVKVTTRIIGQTNDGTIEEVRTPTISVADLTAEYDKSAKELRLAQQALEKANHATDTGFNPQY